MKKDFRDSLLSHKTLAELQYVVSLYSNVDYYDEYKVSAEHISNPHWKIYYGILKNMIEKKSFSVIDSVNTEMFMSSQNEKLQKLYENAGGWATIEEAKGIIESENIESYYREVLRYSAILKLNDFGFDFSDKWESLSKLNLQELSDVMTSYIDDVFVGIDMGEDEVEDIKSGMMEMIIEADKGVYNGLPVASKLLNSTINGTVTGNITMLAGTSGVGKTYITLNQVLPTVIKEEEPILIMCNEEDKPKWQREIITWVINNVHGGDFVKSRFYQGRFTTEEWDVLKKATDWFNKKVEDKLIQFVNFSTFSMDKSIKLIRKYATQYDIKYYIIDTLKLDNDVGSNISDNSWLQLQQNMVKLYNVIKPTAKNCHVWVTYQLNKSNRTRYLDQSALGISKNVADVVSTLLLVRDMLENEKQGESGGLVVKKDGQQIILNEDSDYMVCFIDKNRQGSTSNQIVWRVDKGRNTMIDVGLTRVAQDY